MWSPSSQSSQGEGGKLDGGWGGREGLSGGRGTGSESRDRLGMRGETEAQRLGDSRGRTKEKRDRRRGWVGGGGEARDRGQGERKEKGLGGG